MTPDTPHLFHAFDRLILTMTEHSLEHVRTDHAFELRSTTHGADVWRSSILYAGDESCGSGERFVGSLNSRQVIELLDEIQRSGVYEALPALGIVEGHAIAGAAPLVTMRLISATRDHTVLDKAPADRAEVHDVTEAIRRRIDAAMERALASAG